MPVNLMRDGRLTSVESMSELLAQTLKDAHIRAGNGAVLLSGEYTYLRTTTMPRMSAEQLTYNIPFEFSDYITGDLKDYLFDYAMVPDSPKKDDAPPTGVITTFLITHPLPRRCPLNGSALSNICSTLSFSKSNVVAFIEKYAAVCSFIRARSSMLFIK